MATMGGGHYDPDEPEGKPRSSGHLTRRDVIIVTILLLVLAPVVVVLYQNGRGESEKAFCTQNMRAMGNAFLGYGADNDDRFPPTHNMDSAGGPALTEAGLPVTWASQLQLYMSARQNFLCPSAHRDETTTMTSLKAGEASFPLSYGMYRGLSTVPRNMIPNPDEVVAIAETSDNGAHDTYDPMHFGDGRPDGFLIGWDNSNLEFDKGTKVVTRLALYGSGSGGYEGKKVRGRHGEFVHAVTAGGQLKTLVGPSAKVAHAPPRLKLTWWADPNLYR